MNTGEDETSLYSCNRAECKQTTAHQKHPQVAVRNTEAGICQRLEHDKRLADAWTGNQATITEVPLRVGNGTNTEC